MRERRHDEAARYAEQAAAVARRTGDQYLLAIALRDLGVCATEASDFDRAVALTSEARELFRLLAKTADEAGVVHALASLEWARGEHERARALLHEALALAELAGGRVLVDIAIDDGQTAIYDGRLDDAAELLRRGVVAALDHGARKSAAVAVSAFSALAAARGDAVTAARLLGASEAMEEAVGGDLFAGSIEHAVRARAWSCVREALSREELDHALQAGRLLTEDEAVALARSLH